MAMRNPSRLDGVRAAMTDILAGGNELDEDLDFLIAEDCYLANVGKELNERSLDEPQRRQLWEAKGKEWKKMIDTKSIRIHTGELGH
jgi:hypothetical protein